MIDQALFNATLPAFRTPGGEVYTKMQSFIAEQQARWQQTIDTTHASDTLLQHIDTATLHRAAYNAIPHLDLILTPTGFGIVSNQSTAPASRERVEALREQLRHSASIHEDIVITQAVREKALLHGAITYVDTLLWHPSLLTAYGITTPDGRQVYYEEFHHLQAHIQAAHTQLAHIISPELLTALITHQHTPETDTNRADIYDQLIHRARQILAAIITHQPDHTIHDRLRAILDYITLHADSLPAYTNSRTAAAHRLQPYRNQKEDTTYFFG